jgi:hypothetical protein
MRVHRTQPVLVRSLVVAFGLFVSHQLYRTLRSNTASMHPVHAHPTLRALIPPGMRAVSVRVHEAVTRLTAPGTHVDVLLTYPL